MALHHRHKQRILTTIITLIILIIGVDVYLILSPMLDLATALLYAFTVVIGLTVVYQSYNYRHSHEHTTLVNTLTQIFLGTILFTTCMLMLLLQAIFSIDIIDSYLILSIITILFTFIFLKKFDRFLEEEVTKKFPMGHVPIPKKGFVAPENIQKGGKHEKQKRH
jgi:hypothetical protein